MKYKPGDKVKIKSLEWYNTNKDGYGVIFCNHICFDEKMTKFCGKTVTIVAQRNEKYYFIMEDNCLSFWSEDMIECFVDAEPQEKMVSLKQVCEWLRNNIDFYVETKYDEDFRVDIEQLLNDIRKTM